MKLLLGLITVGVVGCLWTVACTDSGEGSFSSSDSDSDSDSDGDGDGDGDADGDADGDDNRGNVDTNIFPDIPDDDELIMGNCTTGPCVVNTVDCTSQGGTPDSRYECVSGICCNTEGLAQDTERGGVDTDIFPDVPSDVDTPNGSCTTGPCVVNAADCLSQGGAPDNRYTCASGVCCNTSEPRNSDTGTGPIVDTDTGTDTATLGGTTDTVELPCVYTCTSGPINCTIDMGGAIVPGICEDKGTCCDLGEEDTDTADADGGPSISA